MMTREVRLERLHPAEVRAAMAEDPIAWLPLGALEFHAEHLPFGTDGFAAQDIVDRAAQIAGGVVLPWSAVTLGTLRLPWTFRYDHELVEGVLRQTLLQLAAHGARVVIVHTGHGPLDLNHLIKRVCAEVEGDLRGGDDFRAYGLCYLELNAALGVGLGTDWPVAVDHGSIMETSWVLAMEPELVQLERLPQDPDATGIVGIYGPNPRTRASGSLGEQQLKGCAALLAERARDLLAGGRLDPLADLRLFVERYWPEPLTVLGRAGSEGEASLSLRNGAPVSRYLTSLDVQVDGERIDPAAVGLVNTTMGEAGQLLIAASLGPETGFYVRRNQDADVRLPLAVEPGSHRVEIVLGLAGVTSTSIESEIVFS